MRRRTRLTRSFFLLAVATTTSAAATLSTPQLAEGQTQSCVHCLTLFHPDPNVDYGHTASDMGEPEQAYKRGTAPHPGVHAGVMYPGTCESVHGLCPPSGGGKGPGNLFDVSPGEGAGRLTEWLDHLAATLDRGDALEAYMMAMDQPEDSPVYFMPERTAIQVRGCADMVVAHIPLAHLLPREFLASRASE